MVDDILRNGRTVLPARASAAFIPVEFQGAAYRFGHTMVRPSYRANLAGDNGAAVLRHDLRSRRRGPGRPGRPARRRPRAAALHRLADVLRFRATGRSTLETAEQADRHEDLDAAVPPAARRDRRRRRRRTSLPQRNLLRQRHLGAAVGPEHRAAHAACRCSRRPTSTSCGATASTSTSPRRSGTTCSRRPR